MICTINYYTVVGDYFNTMKTTFHFNFDLYTSFKTAWTHKNMKTKRSCQLKNIIAYHYIYKNVLHTLKKRRRAL